jgi:spore coat protein U-like protein
MEVLTVSNNVATLWLEAGDDNSGVYDMRLAEEPTFGGVQWQFYTDTLTTTWPANGVVYVQYRDRAGNLSPVVSNRYEIYLPLVLKQQ